MYNYGFLSPIDFNFIFLQLDSLKPMTFHDRNVELGERWRSLDKSERKEFLQRANSNQNILDCDTRLKRQLRKIKKSVRPKFDVETFSDRRHQSEWRDTGCCYCLFLQTYL